MKSMARYRTNIIIDQPTNATRCDTVFGRFEAGKWAHITATDQTNYLISSVHQERRCGDVIFGTHQPVKFV